jgi:hypothetical protein
MIRSTDSKTGAHVLGKTGAKSFGRMVTFAIARTPKRFGE